MIIKETVDEELDRTKKEYLKQYYLKNKEKISKRKSELYYKKHPKFPKLFIDSGIKKKQCSKCLEIKPFDHFYKNTASTFGITNSCKKCSKKTSKEYNKKNTDKIKLNQKKWYKKNKEYNTKRCRDWRNNGNMDKCVASNKKWKNKNPEKVRAHYLLNKAIKNNEIKKEPCQICGSINHIHGHHDDYNKPYEVKWLCLRHHMAYHKNLLNLVR